MKSRSHVSSKVLSSSLKSGMGVIINYSVYYICNLLANAFMIGMYTVMAFTEHQGCYTRSGFNITTRFELAFKVGLFVLILEVINSNILGIYFRAKAQREEDKCGVVL